MDFDAKSSRLAFQIVLFTVEDILKTHEKGVVVKNWKKKIQENLFFFIFFKIRTNLDRLNGQEESFAQNLD